jgi:hypothetical protein
LVQIQSPRLSNECQRVPSAPSVTRRQGWLPLGTEDQAVSEWCRVVSAYGGQSSNRSHAPEGRRGRTYGFVQPSGVGKPPSAIQLSYSGETPGAGRAMQAEGSPNASEPGGHPPVDGGGADAAEAAEPPACCPSADPASRPVLRPSARPASRPRDREASSAETRAARNDCVKAARRAAVASVFVGALLEPIK